MMQTTIYALRENGFVRYVGKTIKPLESRLGGHLQAARRGEDTYKGRWIRKMFSRGLSPTITVLEVAEGDGSKEEIAWIAYFRSYGIKLTNGTDGGEGGVPTEAVRAKLRRKKPPRTAAHSAKIAAALQGRHPTEEQRANMREAKKGWRCTWGDKISKTLMGHPVSKEQEQKRQVTIAANGGLHHTEKHKQYMHEIMKGRPRPLAAIQKGVATRKANGSYHNKRIRRA